jgi:hypothetical protein
MRNTKFHLGMVYDVWDGEKAWYWLVISPHRNAGAIGVAASHDEAARDARLSIEEITSGRCPQPATPTCGNGPAFQSYDAIVCSKVRWEAALAQLQGYLSHPY